ncbi:MAG: enoyl-CoA hydratase/isomerase family protein [Ramlibacter sp.]
MSEVVAEIRGRAGLITLNRPKALNALSLGMVRELTAALLAWRDDPAVEVVAVRGTGKEGVFGAFCAGGDIRFFHQAALAGNPQLEDFFTEEYALNHLIHTYPKPYVAFMDGIVMGGGMGISQGARVRIVTERTKMAMPETNIGLFPDVGGGFFLGRCPGRVGEYLALTGSVIGGTDALAAQLADVLMPSQDLPDLWESLVRLGTQALPAQVDVESAAAQSALARASGPIDHFFALDSVPAIIAALEADTSDWARETAALLRHRSPLMLHVVLQQVRRGRALGLADDLRMERDLVRHCFHLRPGAASETVEGIRALAVDKDHAPKWNPPRIEDVTPDMVQPFFVSPWPPHAHPLATLR